MRLPLFFKREGTDAARRERLANLERQVTQSLRGLASAFTQLANMIEQRRLSRAGYEKQERFLQRTDVPQGDRAKQADDRPLNRPPEAQPK